MCPAARPPGESALTRSGTRDFFKTERPGTPSGGRDFFKSSAHGVETSNLEELRDDLSRELAEKIDASHHEMQEHLTGVILNALGKSVPPKGERRRRSKTPGSATKTSSSASSFYANTPRGAVTLSRTLSATGQPVDTTTHKCGLFCTGVVPKA